MHSGSKEGTTSRFMFAHLWLSDGLRHSWFVVLYSSKVNMQWIALNKMLEESAQDIHLNLRKRDITNLDGNIQTKSNVPKTSVEIHSYGVQNDSWDHFPSVFAPFAASLSFDAFSFAISAFAISCASSLRPNRFLEIY